MNDNEWPLKSDCHNILTDQDLPIVLPLTCVSIVCNMSLSKIKQLWLVIMKPGIYKMKSVILDQDYIDFQLP